MNSSFNDNQKNAGLEDIGEEDKRVIFNWVTEKERKARVVVDGSMKLMWANGAAYEMLIQGAHIALDKGRVVPRQDELRRKIEQAVRARSQESLFVIEHSDDIGSDLLIRLERLPDSGAKACFGLQLIRHAPAPGGWSELLASHFQLTPKQTEVLMRMISGEAGEDIARAMRITTETVRTHVRDVYGKLRVSSREELFVRVRPFYM